MNGLNCRIMKKVFVPLNTKIPIYKQFPTEEHVWGDYEFILGDSCDECDYVVVLDTLTKPLHVNCKGGGAICFPMEAESIKKYTKEYLQQFDAIFSFQDYILNMPNAKLSIPPFPWMLIYDFYAMDDSVYSKYDYFKTPELNNRLDRFCLFTSNKKMSRGHCDRLFFVDEVKKAIPDLVDVYGSGFNNVDIKYDVMVKYKYCIVIENDKVPYWRTEKLSDAILAGCYPLYYGDPKINEQFSGHEVESLDIFGVQNTIVRMKKIVADNLYTKRLDDIINARTKVLQDWNTFSIIAKCLDKVVLSSNTRDLTIKPLILPKLSSYFHLFKRYFYAKVPYSIAKHYNF